MHCHLKREYNKMRLMLGVHKLIGVMGICLCFEVPAFADCLSAALYVVHRRSQNAIAIP